MMTLGVCEYSAAAAASIAAFDGHLAWRPRRDYDHHHCRPSVDRSWYFETTRAEIHASLASRPSRFCSDAAFCHLSHIYGPPHDLQQFMII